MSTDKFNPSALLEPMKIVGEWKKNEPNLSLNLPFIIEEWKPTLKVNLKITEET